MESVKAVRLDHPGNRVVERYGFRPDLGRLINKVRKGKAKLVRLAHQGRLIYDVPWGETYIRVLVDDTKTTIISILPQQNLKELALEKIKQDAKQNANRKRKFYRGFEDDEIGVTPD